MFGRTIATVLRQEKKHPPKANKVMAIVPLSIDTAKGTKLSIDINYYPLRKRYSPGIVLKKGKNFALENKAKRELFDRIVNEWEWLLLNASQSEAEKVYRLKAGASTRNNYKAMPIAEILREVRGEKPEGRYANVFADSDVPNSVKGLASGHVTEGLDEIDFFAFYDQRHLNRRPHDAYVCIKKMIRKFHGSPDSPLPMKDITKQWVKNFLVFIRTKVCENTATYYFNHTRTILQEAVEAEIIPFNPAWMINKKERPRVKRSDADSLTFQEIQALTQVARPRIHRQGQLMFLLSCFTGLRISDCISLKWNQIAISEEQGERKYRIRVKQIKTQVRINKPLSESAVSILEQRRLEAEEVEDKSDYVFPRYCPEYMTPVAAKSRINKQLKRWGQDAKLDHRMHFHLARHTYATMLLEMGNDITVVQHLLGQKDIRSTIIYAHVSDKLKEGAVKTLPRIDSNDLIPTKIPSKGQKVANRKSAPRKK